MGGVDGKIRIVLFIFALCVSGVLFADKSPVTPEAAETLEKENKFDQAMAVYEEWLKENTADPRFSTILRRCGELKKNPSASIELYTQYVNAVRDPAQKRALYRETALLQTLMGDYRSALFSFERAFDAIDETVGRDPWLTAVPALYIACGETEKAYDWIVRIDPVVSGRGLRAELNYSLLEIYLIRGETEYADRAFSILASEFRTEEAYPQALFRFGVYYISRGEKKNAETYRDVLEKDYPAALETRALRALWDGTAGGSIGLLADPHDILGGERFSEEAVQKTSAEKSPGEAEGKTQTGDQRGGEASGGSWRVQVGSYAVRENAVYIVKDLEKIRFQADIVEAVVGGKRYFRVFVGRNLTADEAQTLLAKLQDAGVGGYLFPADK
ncbi:MAG: SPOR domain-containing protein [Spirochaetales bacterium]|nr:SPOR domain-containing protein [Spirochaetales bacterium]